MSLLNEAKLSSLKDKLLEAEAERVREELEVKDEKVKKIIKKVSKKK